MNRFFWRTKSQQEIDYVEEMNGRFFAMEIKWSRNAKVKLPASFVSAYPECKTAVVTKDNFDDFLLFS
jgi:hypothetical protein